MRKPLFAVCVMLVSTLVAAGCDWPQFLYGAAHTGSTPDTSISADGLATSGLAAAWKVPGAPIVGPVVGGTVFAGAATFDPPGPFLAAYDAAGTTGCSGAPKTCTPLWTAAGGLPTSAAVADGMLIAPNLAGGIAAYDAAGTTGCSGAPKICTPLWTGDVGADVGVVNLAVANDLVYVETTTSQEPPGPGIAVFDPHGVNGCSGSPVVCEPLWTAHVTVNGYGGISVGSGVVALKSNTGLYAFDAAGTSGCTGTPKVCSPLWRADIPGGPAYDLPVIANGTVLVTSSGLGNTYGFDAAGTHNCTGSPKTCTPTLRFKQAKLSPAVGGTTLFSLRGRQVAAYDVTGTTNCNGTSLRTCTPLWKSTVHTGQCDPPGPCDQFSSLVVANNVVYQGYTDAGGGGGDISAYDATGTRNCSSGICQPIGRWTTGGNGSEPPVVANGTVYVSEAAMGNPGLAALRIP
jgi:hypothetical protein